MAGSGKTYWSKKLAQCGFRRFCCDDLIAAELAQELITPNGSSMGVAEWMGFPCKPQYREREARYLACEARVVREITRYLEGLGGDADECVVVDTTGSVIYTGDTVLRRLRLCTKMVFLSTPHALQEQLLEAYISKPHPMVWKNMFRKDPGEPCGKAFERCYPKLFSYRERLYRQYADATVQYDVRRSEDFSVRDFLDAIDRVVDG